MNNFVLRPDVEQALADKRPIVALESSLITHGLPSPHNLNVAHRAEAVIREAGVVPATIAVIDGQIRIGLSANDLDRLASENDVLKLTRDNLATAIAQQATGSTTVAATMICAHRAGIDVFATGGIGGVHRDWQKTLDISADLKELAITPVTVVCSGAKSLLDLSATLEYLETMGVPVLGFGTNELPAFFSVKSGLALRQSVSDTNEAANIIVLRRELNLQGGEVLAVPPPTSAAIPWSTLSEWIDIAMAELQDSQLRGQSVTPFLLARLQELSANQTLDANTALIANNAEIAAALALAIENHRQSL